MMGEWLFMVCVFVSRSVMSDSWQPHGGYLRWNLSNKRIKNNVNQVSHSQKRELNMEREKISICAAEANTGKGES